MNEFAIFYNLKHFALEKSVVTLNIVIVLLSECCAISSNK